MNGPQLITLDDPELDGLIRGNRDRGNRHVSFHAAMEVDHLLDVHTVDVIGAKDGDQKIVCDIEQIQILEYSVGGTSIPAIFFRTKLGSYGNDELILQQTAELPAVAQVAQQGITSVLNEHIDRAKAGVDEIAESEVDDAILAAEWNCRFRAFLSQR